MAWINFFNPSLDARGTDDLLGADLLRETIARHDGSEAYHSAFDLEDSALKLEEDTGQIDEKGKKIYRYHAQSPEGLNRWPRTVAKYSGPTRPALGYVWFDFDSKDGGLTALIHARECLQWLGHPGVLTYYSGSKGFHLGIPLGLFGLEPSTTLNKALHLAASQLKKTRWDSLDTTVFNPQRKFRALGTRHPKTGLFKIPADLGNDPAETALSEIKALAAKRGIRAVPDAPTCPPHAELVALCARYSEASRDSISLTEWKRYRQPEGTRALAECDFLKHCASNAATLSEPEWYAAASIVGRFKDGRARFQALSRGHPSYSPTKTDEKLEQALQASGPRTCQAINALWGKCSGCTHFEKIKSPVVILEKEVIPTEATGFYHIFISPQGHEKRTPDYEGLLAAFKRDFKYFRDSRAERTYVWNGTHYAVVGATDVLAWCESVMDPAPSQRVASEFKAKIDRNCVKPREEIDSFFFTSTSGKLNLKNGVLDIATGSLYPHDDRIGFRYVLPYDYDPAATAPVFEKFLDEVTLSRDELKKTLLEFMGYCLWPSYDDHCFLWLTGGGRNGKSALMELITALVGDDNTSAVKIENLVKSNFVEMMNHKLVNISDEVISSKISSELVSQVKSLSAGSLMQVDQKYELPYMMRPTAKLIFSSNVLPTFSGSEDALKSRLIVVPFDLRLEVHGAEETISKIDWQLGEKMKGELPGILNLVLRSLKEFTQRRPRKIYRSKVGHDAMNEIMRDSDLVERWIQDCVEFLPTPGEGPGLLALDLYAAFKQYAQGETQYIPEYNSFSRRLRSKFGNQSLVTRQQNSGKRDTVFFGIHVDLKRDF
jgi:P4 family phage/plasmid primase-like protien